MGLKSKMGQDKARQKLLTNSCQLLWYMTIKRKEFSTFSIFFGIVNFILLYFIFRVN